MDRQAVKRDCPIGARVRASGLKQEWLNGKVGTVRKYQMKDDKIRVVVDFGGESGMFAVKVNNLERVCDSESRGEKPRRQGGSRERAAGRREEGGGDEQDEGIENLAVQDLLGGTAAAASDSGEGESEGSSREGKGQITAGPEQSRRRGGRRRGRQQADWNRNHQPHSGKGRYQGRPTDRPHSRDYPRHGYNGYDEERREGDDEELLVQAHDRGSRRVVGYREELGRRRGQGRDYGDRDDREYGDRDYGYGEQGGERYDRRRYDEPRYQDKRPYRQREWERERDWEEGYQERRYAAHPPPRSSHRGRGREDHKEYKEPPRRNDSATRHKREREDDLPPSDKGSLELLEMKRRKEAQPATHPAEADFTQLFEELFKQDGEDKAPTMSQVEQLRDLEREIEALKRSNAQAAPPAPSPIPVSTPSVPVSVVPTPAPAPAPAPPPQHPTPDLRNIPPQLLFTITQGLMLGRMAGQAEQHAGLPAAPPPPPPQQQQAQLLMQLAPLLGQLGARPPAPAVPPGTRSLPNLPSVAPVVVRSPLLEVCFKDPIDLHELGTEDVFWLFTQFGMVTKIRIPETRPVAVEVTMLHAEEAAAAASYLHEAVIQSVIGPLSISVKVLPQSRLGGVECIEKEYESVNSVLGDLVQALGGNQPEHQKEELKTGLEELGRTQGWRQRDFIWGVWVTGEGWLDPPQASEYKGTLPPKLLSEIAGRRSGRKKQRGGSRGRRGLVFFNGFPLDDDLAVKGITLPGGFSAERFWNFAGMYGKLVGVAMMRTQRTYLAEYAEPLDADAAIKKLDGVYVFGRELKVEQGKSSLPSSALRSGKDVSFPGATTITNTLKVLNTPVGFNHDGVASLLEGHGLRPLLKPANDGGMELVLPDREQALIAAAVLNGRELPGDMGPVEVKLAFTGATAQLLVD